MDQLPVDILAVGCVRGANYSGDSSRVFELVAASTRPLASVGVEFWPTAESKSSQSHEQTAKPEPLVVLVGSQTRQPNRQQEPAATGPQRAPAAPASARVVALVQVVVFVVVDWLREIELDNAQRRAAQTSPTTAAGSAPVFI